MQRASRSRKTNEEAGTIQKIVAWSRGQQCGWQEAVRFCLDFEEAATGYGDCFDLRGEKERRVTRMPPKFLSLETERTELLFT